VKLDGLDGDGDPHVLALAARIPHLVVVALNAPGCVARDAIAGLEDVLQVPEIVHALRHDGDPLAATLDLLPGL